MSLFAMAEIKDERPSLCKTMSDDTWSKKLPYHEKEPSCVFESHQEHQTDSKAWFKAWL